jgi:hypothetical protein
VLVVSAIQNRKKKTEMIDGINVMKVSFKDIEDLEIISFTELPEERQKFALSDIEDKENFVKDMSLAIQNCLIDPERWSEFENLSEEDLLVFFWKWAISSTLTDETI